MAFFRGVGVLPLKQPSATTNPLTSTVTLQCTLGYKPTITVVVETLTPPVPTTPVPTTVTVTVGTSAFTSLNQTTTATAVVRDQFTNVMTSGYTLSWASAAPLIASAVASPPSPFNTATVTCLATGGSGGIAITATVVGSAPPISGFANVTTPSQVATVLRLSPTSLTLNDSLVHFLTPTMQDQFGAAMPTGSIAWSSNDATFKITVNSSGGVQATAGNIVATITALSSLGPSANAVATSTAPVLTAITLSPGNTTLSSGTVTEVPTTVDQFGQPIGAISGGGSVTFTTGAGVGLSVNNAALATAAAVAVVFRLRIDEWTASSAGSIGMTQLDDGTVGSGHTRIALTLGGNAGVYTAALFIPGIGTLTTGNIPAASMPPSGSDVVIYGAWGSGAAKIAAYTGAGTNTLIDPNAVATSGGGSIPAVTNGGQVRINTCFSSGTNLGSTTRWQGIAWYTAARPAGHEDQKPTVGDANIAYMSIMNDATSGIVPGTAAAQVGAGGLVLTPGDFAWSADNSGGQWNGSSLAFNFVSSAPQFATVGASTGIVTYVSAGSTTITCNIVGNPGITGSCVVTTGAGSTPSSLLITPATTFLPGVSSTALVQVTPVVKDQSSNIMSGVTVNVTTSNAGDVGVPASVVTPAIISATWQGATPRNIMNGYDFGVSGILPHSATTPPTGTNPGGCVSFGGPSDSTPGPPATHPGLAGVVNAAFPSGFAMQFANGTGADIQFGGTGQPVGSTSYICVEWEHFWDTNVVTSGNFKFCRTRSNGYGNLNGSLLVQNNLFGLYFDNLEGGNGQFLNVASASALADGLLHRFRFIVSTAPAPQQFIQLYIDGALKGTMNASAMASLAPVPPGATYTAPSGPPIGIIEFYETVNSGAGGIRQIGRVWMATYNFVSQP